MIDKKVKLDIEKWNSDDFHKALQDGDIEAYTGSTTLHFIQKEADMNSPAYQNMINDNGKKIGPHAAIELINQITRKIKEIEYNQQHTYG
ncbi:MAG: hypothetical protein KAJ56_03040 [Candidatus Aenigmarchaeota archaeon]|nr:hypothetical protein [Candidatus Aenigmarchaeota archaeon]MCK5289896.1 hypothetical protein [Candidatus Aenigmarchaeota archaeon]